jgi:hypothetical protein
LAASRLARRSDFLAGTPSAGLVGSMALLIPGVLRVRPDLRER